MKTLKTIILGTILGLSINFANAGGFGASFGLGSGVRIGVEKETDLTNKIFLFNNLTFSKDSNRSDTPCDPLVGYSFCYNETTVNSYDIDFNTGLGYKFEHVDLTIYAGLGRRIESTQKAIVDHKTLINEDGESKEVKHTREGSNLEQSKNMLKTTAGLRVDYEINNTMGIFIDDSVSKYGNSNSFSNRIVAGIKISF